MDFLPIKNWNSFLMIYVISFYIPQTAKIIVTSNTNRWICISVTVTLSLIQLIHISISQVDFEATGWLPAYSDNCRILLRFRIQTITSIMNYLAFWEIHSRLFLILNISFLVVSAGLMLKNKQTVKHII